MGEIQVFEQLPPQATRADCVSNDPHKECREVAKSKAPAWVMLSLEYKHGASASSCASIISANRGSTKLWAGFRAVSRKIDGKYRILIQWKGED